MQQILLTIGAVAVFLLLLFGIWGGVHLLANFRLGFRRMGCQGPRADAYGNQICCKTGGPCDAVTEEAEKLAEAGHSQAGK